MLFLALAVSCSLAIGMLFKHTARLQLDPMALLTVNYGIALLVAGAMLVWGPQNELTGSDWSGSLITLGVMTGALFIFGFLIYAVAIDVAGMSLAIGVMRISVVVPFLASWWIWSEVPSVLQGIGLGIASIAFFLIASKSSDQQDGAPGGKASAKKVVVVLGTLFISGGLVDLSLKVFDEGFAATNSRPTFLFLVFGVAFLIGMMDLLYKGWRRNQWLTMATLMWGIILGVINYGSVEFLLLAVRDLPGTFVFPANSITLVIGGAILGVVFWKERLSRMNLWGLALAALALVFLSLS